MSTGYRYRDESHTTRGSLKRLAFTKKVGRVRYVRGYVYRRPDGITRTAVIVRGDQGSSRFSGFCWGYSGEGPRGLKEMLAKIGIPQDQIEYVAHRTTVPDKVGEYWRLTAVGDRFQISLGLR